MIEKIQKYSKKRLCLLLAIIWMAVCFNGCGSTSNLEEEAINQQIDPMQDACIESFMKSSGIEWISNPIASETAEWALVLTPDSEAIDGNMNVVVSKFKIADMPKNEEDIFLFVADFLTNNGSNGYDYEIVQFQPKQGVNEAAFLVRSVSAIEAYEAREDYQRAILIHQDDLYSFVGKGEGLLDESDVLVTTGSLIQTWVESLGGDSADNSIKKSDTYWLYSDERIITDEEKSLTMYQTEENGIYKWVYELPLATASDALTFTILNDGMADDTLYSMQIATTSDAQYSFQTIDSMYAPDFLLEDINQDGWADLLLEADYQVWIWDPAQHLFIPSEEENLLKATASVAENNE